MTESSATSVTINYKQYFKFGRVEFPPDNKTLGIGVFATRPIPKGTCILSESPIIVATMTNLEYKVSQLNETSRRQMFALVDSHVTVSKPKKTPVGIFRSNAYPCSGHVEEGASRDFGGLFPIFARFNSSCIPNVSHRYIPAEDCRNIYTARDICEGEELLTCYIDPPYMNRDDRRSVLEERFNFTCGCTACSYEGERLRESDSDRVMLNRLDDITFEHIRHGRYAEGIQAVEKRIELLKKEEIDSPAALMRVCYDAYQACDHWKDIEGAKKWLTRVREFTELCDTEKSADEVKSTLDQM